MTCPHHLADGPLVCTRTDRHDPDAPGGHTYISSSASHLDDRHGEDSHA